MRGGLDCPTSATPTVVTFGTSHYRVERSLRRPSWFKATLYP